MLILIDNYTLELDIFKGNSTNKNVFNIGVKILETFYGKVIHFVYSLYLWDSNKGMLHSKYLRFLTG